MTRARARWARVGAGAALMSGVVLAMGWFTAGPSPDAGALPGPVAASPTPPMRAAPTPAASAASAASTVRSRAAARTAVRSRGAASADDRRSGIAVPTTPTLGTRPATLEALRRDVGPDPVSVAIPALGINAPVSAVDVTASDQLEVPPTGAQVGWYRHGPAPGERGSAVLAGHVDYDGRPGVFFDLRRLEPSALVVVRYDDGSRRRFEVQARRRYPKTALPVRRLFTQTGRPVVTLVTCGGAFDTAVGSYADNVVVYATPVGRGQSSE